MPTLTITSRGQVTFRKDLLHHLGISHGDKIEVEKLRGGRVSVQAVKSKGTIDDFIGLLARKTNKIATLEDIEKAIEDGWAGLAEDE